jgi:hypothetical protein
MLAMLVLSIVGRPGDGRLSNARDGDLMGSHIQVEGGVLV